MNNITRRNFIKKSSIGTTGIMASTGLVTLLSCGDSNAHSKPNKMDNNSAIIKVRPLQFQWETLDPFIFCVHHEDLYPEGNDQLGPAPGIEGRSIGQDFGGKDGWNMYHGQVVPGFPQHPHCGFETITIVRKGIVDHVDSAGGQGRFGNGDVQWVTAGKGIMHSEMFPLIDKNGPNTMELFQIWLNLPSKSKFAEPNFLMFWGEDIPQIKSKNEAGKITDISVIAGDLGDSKALTPPPDSWAADPNNGLAIWNIKMEAGASYTLPKALPGLNRTLYFFNGPSINIDGQDISKYQAIDLKSDEEVEIVNGNEASGMLMLQGRPIGERVVQEGPFVATSSQGIRDAKIKYQNGEFGVWPVQSSAPTHPRDKERFALYPNGTLVNPEK